MWVSVERALLVGCWLLLALGQCAEENYFRLHSNETMVIPTDSAEADSRVHCAALCGSSSLCDLFDWSAASGQCSLFRRSCVGTRMSGLFKRLQASQQGGDSCCPSNKAPNEQGVCVCSNGQYGEYCNQTFTHLLSTPTPFPMDACLDATQVEIDGVSVIIWLSEKNGTDLGYLKVFTSPPSIPESYTLKQVIQMASNPSNVEAFTFQNDVFLVVSSGRVLSNFNSVPQITYKFNRTARQFVPIYSETENGVSFLSVHLRSSGQLYTCSVIGNVTGLSSMGPKMKKLNSTSMNPQVMVTIPHWGIHSSCTLLEIDGLLFTLADSGGIEPAAMYRLDNGETWTLQQVIPSSEATISLTTVYSPLINTRLLAMGKASGGLKVYRWNNTEFVACPDLVLSQQIPHPQLIAAGFDIFLALDFNNTQSVNFKLYQFASATCTFSFLRTVPGNGPYGGFHLFWYNDQLHLMVINYFKGILALNDTHKFQANQQLFLWQ